MSDETPEENKDNEQELFDALRSDVPTSSAEGWIMYNEIYQGMISGGFTDKEALTILSDLMWRMMKEGGM